MHLVVNEYVNNTIIQFDYKWSFFSNSCKPKLQNAFLCDINKTANQNKFMRDDNN